MRRTIVLSVGVPALSRLPPLAQPRTEQRQRPSRPAGAAAQPAAGHSAGAAAAGAAGEPGAQPAPAATRWRRSNAPPPVADVAPARASTAATSSTPRRPARCPSASTTARWRRGCSSSPTRRTARTRKTRPVSFLYNGGPGSASRLAAHGVVRAAHVRRWPTRASSRRRPTSSWTTRTRSSTSPTSCSSTRSTPASAAWCAGVNNAQFHDQEGDIRAFGEFIDEYLKAYSRWPSPKFLIGESYGTIRSAGLVAGTADAPRHRAERHRARVGAAHLPDAVAGAEQRHRLRRRRSRRSRPPPGTTSGCRPTCSRSRSSRSWTRRARSRSASTCRR